MQSSDLAGADRIAVYGFAREGRALVRHLRVHAPDSEIVVLLDETADDETRSSARAAEVSLVEGADAVRALLTRDGLVDVVLRSPGVPLHHGPLAAGIRAHPRRPVTTGNSLWLGDHTPRSLVAITGTKGKSTTSTLLAHVLRSLGRRVALEGNIGTPLLELGAPDDLDVVVVELSSYQLADLEGRLPIGVWLNVHREHLPWHGSLEQYVADKARIAWLSDTLVANAADPEVASRVARHPDVHWFDATTDPLVVGGQTVDRQAVVDALAASPLVGAHHVANLSAVLAAAALVGASPAEVLPTVASVEALPHRLQLVHDDGRRWVDDSIATIPEAAVAGLQAFPDVPVTLLAGGHDRGQDHAPLVAAIAAHGRVRVITLPDTGARLAEDLASSGHGAVESAVDLRDAVTRADACTPLGGVVLLSPAAPSFGRFRSFEDRGVQFAALARDVGRPD